MLGKLGGLPPGPAALLPRTRPSNGIRNGTAGTDTAFTETVTGTVQETAAETATGTDTETAGVTLGFQHYVAVPVSVSVTVSVKTVSVPAVPYAVARACAR